MSIVRPLGSIRVMSRFTELSCKSFNPENPNSDRTSNLLTLYAARS